MTLEQFVDELIRRSKAKGYHPTAFMRMRAQYGTVEAIRRIVETSEPQSGFVRLRELDLLDWSLESAVLQFQNEPAFTRKTIEYAKARLAGTLDF